METHGADDVQITLTELMDYVEVVTSHVDTLYNKLVQFRDHVLNNASTPDSETQPEQKDAFRPASKQFNTALTKTERHDNGIYFTPKPVRDRLFDVLVVNGVTNPSTILEPSAGSGEFVYDAAERWPSARIIAVEKHEKLCASLKPSATISTHNADFLTFKHDSVDVVIGNPPYFVTKQKQPACMTGRGNIYVQFIYKCLTEHLKPGGVLAFVLPTSFYNCSYYEPCRKYMAANTHVLHLENLDADFYDTAQDTMLMVVRCTPLPPGFERPYYFEFGGKMYLSPYYRELKAIVGFATTVSSLGLSVKTGEVVWNEHKDKLHATEGELVIYSSNIVKNTLVLDNLGGAKKQRICGFGKQKQPVTGPAILIGRGYGNKFTLSFVKISAGTTFYGENHINVVTGPAASLDRLYTSLSDSRTTDFLRMFVGNGALSKSEIEELLPVF